MTRPSQECWTSRFYQQNDVSAMCDQMNMLVLARDRLTCTPKHIRACVRSGSRWWEVWDPQQDKQQYATPGWHGTSIARMTMIAQYVAQCLKHMMSARKQSDPLTCTIEMLACLNAFHKAGPAKMLRLKQNTKHVNIQKEYYQCIHYYYRKVSNPVVSSHDVSKPLDKIWIYPMLTYASASG